MAHFTQELYKLLGIEMVSSTVWHLQMDRQMEQVNQELDKYLCLFMNEQQCYEMTPKKKTLFHAFINLMGNLQKYNEEKL